MHSIADEQKDKPWIDECKCLLKGASNALANPMFGWSETGLAGASSKEKLVVLGYQHGLRYLSQFSSDQTLLETSKDKTVVALAGDCRYYQQDDYEVEPRGNITFVADS